RTEQRPLKPRQLSRDAPQRPALRFLRAPITTPQRAQADAVRRHLGSTPDAGLDSKLPRTMSCRCLDRTARGTYPPRPQDEAATWPRPLLRSSPRGCCTASERRDLRRIALKPDANLTLGRLTIAPTR